METIMKWALVITLESGEAHKFEEFPTLYACMKTMQEYEPVTERTQAMAYCVSLGIMV